MKKRAFTASSAIHLVLAVAAAGALMAQDVPPSSGTIALQGEDSGVWVILAAGKEIGRETFSRAAKPEGGWLHRSKTKVQVGDMHVAFESELDTGAKGEPLSYVLDVEQSGAPGGASGGAPGGAPKKTRVKVAFGAESLTASVEGQPQPVEKTEPYAERPFVLDNNFFSHYWYLLQQFRAAGQEKTLAFAYVPQALSMLHVIVNREGDEAVEFAGGKPVLHKVFVDVAGSVGLNVHYDAQGEPVKIDIPLQMISAVREGYAPAPAPDIRSGPAEAAPSAEARETPQAAPEDGQAAAPPEEAAPEAQEAVSEQLPLREEKVKFKNGKVALAGTLLLPPAEVYPPRREGATDLPAVAGRKYPAAVILSGSGPQDRDGNFPGGSDVMHSFYRLLAERLAGESFAVLRFDDRGVGESGGSLDTASVADLANDARAAAKWLRARKDVDKSDVAVLGHSEGAVLALMLGSEKKPLVSRLVLLGGTSSPLKDVLREQLELVPAGEMRDATRQSQDELFALVETGENEGLLHGQKVNLKWFREHFALDPSGLARKTKIPVLILQAEKDRQVLSHHANRLYEALTEAGVPVALEILPGLDHLFLPSQTGSIAEYGRTRNYGAEPFDSLVKWLTENETGE